MISLKKSMQMDAEGLIASTLEAYRAALLAMGKAGVQACPPAGESLQQSLQQLQAQLTAVSSQNIVAETEERVSAELLSWGDRAAGYYRDRTNDVKEIMTIVAKAAVDVGDRDERYSNKFKELTIRLQESAKLQDVTSIRESLNRNVADLTKCVTKMTEDGRESIGQLRAQISTYEARLEEVELLASQDALTGLANRRKVERQIELRGKENRRFCVIYLDLNGFKQVNDRHGHLAGDDLLRQVATELKGVFRPTDLVGRWGGDEFIVLVDGNGQEAETLLQRIDKWVQGDYTVSVGAEQRNISVKAAAGMAEWIPGLSASELISRADKAMYQNKQKQ
jgi:diguanylate cyclase (GGDEF)-like protein